MSLVGVALNPLSPIMSKSVETVARKNFERTRGRSLQRNQTQKDKPYSFG